MAKADRITSCAPSAPVSRASSISCSSSSSVAVGGKRKRKGQRIVVTSAADLGDDKLHEWSKTKLERLIRYIRENKEKDIRQHYQKAQRLADVRAAWVDDWAPLIIE